jgi:hypothetical protein
MLIDMRVALESNRSLLYSTAKWVDLQHKLEEHIAELKAERKPFSDEMARFKKASKIAALLTPMTKYVLTEASNRICYDALQIHGGAGYMREFNIERLVRDARITNIYEGTSQLQIVAAIGGVMNDVLAEYFDEKEKESYPSSVLKLADYLKEMRKIFVDSLKFVVDRKDKTFQDVTAKELVEMYSYLYVGYLLLDETKVDDRKIFVANRYIVGARSNARRNSEAIFSEQFSDLPHADKILT